MGAYIDEATGNVVVCVLYDDTDLIWKTSNRVLKRRASVSEKRGGEADGGLTAASQTIKPNVNGEGLLTGAVERKTSTSRGKRRRRRG